MTNLELAVGHAGKIHAVGAETACHLQPRAKGVDFLFYFLKRWGSF
jgi:hypothetical protein